MSVNETTTSFIASHEAVHEAAPMPETGNSELDLPLPDPEREIAVRRKRRCMLMFDSLGGQGNAAYRMLQKYLSYSWAQNEVKKRTSGVDHPETSDGAADIAMSQSDRDASNQLFTPAKFPRWLAESPQQENHCDCGVFVCHYVERFLEGVDKYADAFILFVCIMVACHHKSVAVYSTIASLRF